MAGSARCGMETLLLFCLEKSTGISAWKTGRNRTAKALRQGRPSGISPSTPKQFVGTVAIPAGACFFEKNMRETEERKNVMIKAKGPAKKCHGRCGI